MIEYELFENKFINRWLVSDVKEEVIEFEPVTLNGDINLWMKEGFSVHENPCKTIFVKERKEKHIDLENIENLVPYFPFNNINVDYSGFWFVPTYLTRWATTVIKSDCKHNAKFSITTCGGATLWINNKKIIEHNPFDRNMEKTVFFNAELEDGDNHFTVFYDDLAERDTYFYFRLEYLSEQKISQCLDIEDKISYKVKQVEKFLESMYFDKQSYTSGDIKIYFDKFDIDNNLELFIEAGSEENLAIGNKIHKKVSLNIEKNYISIGKTEEYAVGFLEVEISIIIDGIKIKNKMKLENYPVSLLPDYSKDINIRKNQTIEFLSKYGEDNINKAVAIIKSGGNYNEAEQIIDRQLIGINARYDCSDFHLVYIPWIWSNYKDNGIMSKEIFDRMYCTMRDFRYWMDEPGDDVMWFYSENHALMFHVCQLLVGELFPDLVFTNSKLTGLQMQVKAKKLLLNWFDSFFATGLTEWNSSAYLPINALGLGNLYLQTKDSELKNLSKKALDFLYKMLAINSKDAYLACSAGRIYQKELMGNYINASTSMSYVGYGVGSVNQAAKGILSICLSDYQPPEEYEKYFNSHLIFKATQGYDNHVNLYTYKTKDYMLSSAIDFKHFKSGYQEHVIHCVFDAEAQFWLNHPGELAVNGCARPSYWAGNGTLPRVNQFKGYATIFYNIDPNHLVQFTHIYLPENNFDKVIYNENWIFILKKNAFAAIYSENKPVKTANGINKNIECKINSLKNAFIIRTGNIEEFESFDNFIFEIKNAKLNLNVQNRSIEFYDPKYGKLFSGENNLLEINNEKEMYFNFGTKGKLELI